MADQIGTPERLRMVAAWYEQHRPSAAFPTFTYIFDFDGHEPNGEGPRIIETVLDADALVDRTRALGGKWTKLAHGESYFATEREIVPGIWLRICVERKQVCERVVTGTETVMVPAPDAEMVEVEREIVEWRCPDSLLAIGAVA